MSRRLLHKIMVFIKYYLLLADKDCILCMEEFSSVFTNHFSDRSKLSVLDAVNFDFLFSAFLLPFIYLSIYLFINI